MSLFNLIKEIKKQLRRRKRWLTLAVWFIVLMSIASAAWVFRPDHQTNLPSVSLKTIEAWNPMQEPEKKMVEQLEKQSNAQRVILQKNYVCGEDVTDLGFMEPKEIMKLHDEHQNWTVTFNAEGHVYFIESIDDLSPQCKENAYFGLDGKGNLSLFEGLPREEKVIQTFFQLNIGHLESSLPEGTLDQLYEGIRVNDLIEYNSVLSTFSDYAVEESQKAMNSES